ncbi:hypothetical protein CQA48_30460, partial [Klebsiella pneumoniae]
LARVILAEAARNRLQQWSWPGNVRELEHAIHRAISASSAACGWGWRGSFWLRRRETGCSSGPGRATCANWSMLSIG